MVRFSECPLEALLQHLPARARALEVYPLGFLFRLAEFITRVLFSEFPQEGTIATLPCRARALKNCHLGFLFRLAQLITRVLS